MGSVTRLLPRHERQVVRAKAHRLQRDLTRYPGTARRLRRRVCYQVAAIAPELGAGELSLLVRHTLWSYLLDDSMEHPDVDLAALARLRDSVAEATAGNLPRSDDPLLAELARIVDELSQHDRAGHVVARFGEALRDAVTAELDQRRLVRAVASGDSPPPNAERYLAVGARTVNYRSFAYALLAVSAGSFSGPQLACIDSALWDAAHAVRLGNDLRSLARDDPADSLNVLRLQTDTGAAVTPEHVRAEIDRRVQAHDAALRALAGLHLIPSAPARTLTRCLRQVVRLYQRTDLR